MTPLRESKNTSETGDEKSETVPVQQKTAAVLEEYCVRKIKTECNRLRFRAVEARSG